MLKELEIPYPEYGTAWSVDDPVEVANKVGYPVLVRPSYVLGGQRMRIVINDEEVEKAVVSLLKYIPGNKILIDHFLDRCHEAEIDRVKDTQEAIACANDNEYGLSAAVFGRDIARAFNVARKIDSGICHVNAPTVHDEAQMPFGGVKGSGYGRFGGKAGVDAFTELRWSTMQTGPGHYPF